MEARLTFKSSELVNNTAYGQMSDGGAIHMYGSKVSSSFSKTLFRDNTAEDVGGAVAAQSIGNLFIEDGQFLSNHAAGGGGLFVAVQGNHSLYSLLQPIRFLSVYQSSYV